MYQIERLGTRITLQLYTASILCNKYNSKYN